jgi:hypothetical protein
MASNRWLYKTLIQTVAFILFVGAIDWFIFPELFRPIK